MAKPHEQTWRMHRQMVVNERDECICRMQGSASTSEAEALVVAAPDIARALLAITETSPMMDDGRLVVSEEAWRAVLAALSKAGVLP